MDEKRLEEIRQMARDEAIADFENQEATASGLLDFILVDELSRRGYRITAPGR